MGALCAVSPACHITFPCHPRLFAEASRSPPPPNIPSIMKTFMSVLAAAAILAVASAAANAPGQVHIAYAGNAAGRSDGMTVSWQTDSNTATSTVKYGTSPGQYTHTATGSEATYGFTVSHHVTFTGLEPGQKYYYVAGDEAGGWSAEASFVAAPAIGAKADPWSVAIYGGAARLAALVLCATAHLAPPLSRSQMSVTRLYCRGIIGPAMPPDAPPFVALSSSRRCACHAVTCTTHPGAVHFKPWYPHCPCLHRGVDNSKDTIALLNKNLDDQDFIWHVGDISYAGRSRAPSPSATGAAHPVWPPFPVQMTPSWQVWTIPV